MIPDESKTPSRPGRWAAVCSTIFGLGVIWLIGFGFGEHWPPTQQSALTLAAILIAFGLLVPTKGYRIAALLLMTFAIFKAYQVHEKAVPIRQKLKEIGLDARP